MSKKLTTEKFVEKSKIIHNNKFNYDKTIYINGNLDVIIICPIHGDFLQKPKYHLQGKGCIKCAGIYQPNTEEFVKKSRLIHGNKYDYSLVNYVNNRNYIKIICKKHGIFKQSPGHHLNGQGCRECGNEKNTKSQSFTTIHFIQNSKKIHGNKYDYSKSNYINANTDVIITCPIHGDFKQLPLNHVNKKKGCKTCGRFESSKKQISNINVFIKKSNKIHNNYYNYSKFIYKTALKKSIIICPKHGEFPQTPNSHLSGHGCPLCFNVISKPETEWLNLLNIKPESRQQRILGYKVDAFQDGIIYEFLGDYWHGNPNSNKFKPTDYNSNAHKTFGELYNETLNKFNRIKSHGYCIHWIWESDWINYKKGIDKIPNIITY